MANNRKVVINVHSSENKAPDAGILNYGEIAVSHSSKKNAALYTKTSDGAVAKFISEDAIKDEIGKISAHTDDLVGIVQNLANLTITDIQATTPINATEKAIVASSCGNTVTISHVADKTAQSGFKKLTTDTYGHVTGGEDVVIGDISGLNGFEEAIKGVETKLAYSSAGTGNAVTSISVNDHTITANFGKEFSESGHKHVGTDITGGTVGIDYLPTSTAVTSSSDDTTIPTSKAVHAAVSGTVNGLKKEASSVQGQFVRTVIQENGLVSENKGFITDDDIKLSAVTPSSTTVKEEYALYNGEGTQLGDSIKIYKDQSLVSITLEDKDESQKPGQYLKYTYIDASGKTQSTYVDVSKLLVEAEFKSGVTADSTGIVHGVVDSASEKFLTVGTDGFKLSGVQDAINSAINGVNTGLQELSGSVKTLSSTTESFSAATVAGIAGLDTKIGNETTRATAAENSISGAVNTLSAATESFSAATVAEIARVEGKLSDDEKVIAESFNQLNAKVDKVQELNAKVDKVQKGAGLNEDGSYASHNTANYIAGATSLDDADMKLDSAVKAESDRAAAADQTLQANIDKKVSKDDDTWLENFMPKIVLNKNGSVKSVTVGDNVAANYSIVSTHLSRYGGVVTGAVTGYQDEPVLGRVVQVFAGGDALFVTAIFNYAENFSREFANSIYEIVLNYNSEGEFVSGTYKFKPISEVFEIGLSGRDGQYRIDVTYDEFLNKVEYNFNSPTPLIILYDGWSGGAFFLTRYHSQQAGGNYIFQLSFISVRDKQLVGYYIVIEKDKTTITPFEFQPTTKDELDEAIAAMNTSVDKKIAQFQNDVGESLDYLQAEIGKKQDIISDLDAIRTNAVNGQTAFGWGDHAKAGYTKAFIVNITGDGSTENPYVVDKTRDEVAAALAANSPILLKGGAADFPGYSEIYPLTWATDYPSQSIVLQFGNINKESLTYTTMVLAFSYQDSSVSVMASSTQLATSGQVQTLSGSVVSIENREQNYASAITINGITHTVANNSVNLGSFLSANTAHIKTIHQESNASAVTTTINYVTESGSASTATITQDLIIDCGTY